MSLFRLYQPRQPAFWLMLALNALSFALIWVIDNRSLNTTGKLVVGGFALGNALLGAWLAWRLMRNTTPER